MTDFVRQWEARFHYDQQQLLDPKRKEGETVEQYRARLDQGEWDLTRLVQLAFIDSVDAENRFKLWKEYLDAHKSAFQLSSQTAAVLRFLKDHHVSEFDEKKESFQAFLGNESSNARYADFSRNIGQAICAASLINDNERVYDAVSGVLYRAEKSTYDGIRALSDNPAELLKSFTGAAGSKMIHGKLDWSDLESKPTRVQGFYTLLDTLHDRSPTSEACATVGVNIPATNPPSAVTPAAPPQTARRP